MQSQQKKVKWSRGETADALEERTDTGITQVSVSKLENIIADIYGNISRRPALKIVSEISGSQTPQTPVFPCSTGPYISPTPIPPATFVFTVNQNKYILLVVGYNEIAGFLIENEKFVRKINFTDKDNPSIDMSIPGSSADFGRKASFAQSNNFGVMSGVWSTDKIIRLTATDDITVEDFKFTAPWYAPNGTQSITISDTEITNLEFNNDGLGFTAFAWTDDNGISSPYSLIDTGVDGDVSQVESYIPVGSIIKFPNLGAYMRVEGYNAGGSTVYFGTITFDGVLSYNQSVPSTGKYARCEKYGALELGRKIVYYLDGTKMEEAKVSAEGWVQNSTSVSGYSEIVWSTASWQDVPSGSLDIQVFGPLLTPVANSNGKDKIVTVETGYVSLDTYQPMEFMFSQQRLYAAKFTNTESQDIQEIPGYVVGSQIARYNDFKNDYNTNAEAVVIDINTAYQEQVVHMADYNGLKIFTTDSEYAYSSQNGCVKQSTNGSSPDCRPVVFGSTLLYVDKSKRQIRALQYEFQTDIFQSSVINTMCQDDLVFNPVAIATQYDKENHTGSFLYVVQQTIVEGNIGGIYHSWTKAPSLISCNFVPGNQAEIWSRWNIPTLEKVLSAAQDVPTVVNTVVVNNKPWFIITALPFARNSSSSLYAQGYTLAELSYDNLLDFETEVDPTDTRYSFCRNTGKISLTAWESDAGTIYTKYSENWIDDTHTGDPVYNDKGTQIGTLTSGTDPEHAIYTVQYNGYTYHHEASKDILVYDLTLPNRTVSVYDGDEYKWDDTLDANGNYTKSLAGLTNPRVGFKINAELVSHPIDVGGKTYTDHKRIGKCVAVVRDTEAGAFTICDKTGYMDNDKKKINFYGCTGMKDEVRYTIKNINGAKFTIESLTMIIEYATLDS